MERTVQPELLKVDRSQTEIEEKSIRRADKIRREYGTLSNFLKEVCETQRKSDCVAEDIDERSYCF
jgi:hypothetical protein